MSIIYRNEKGDFGRYGPLQPKKHFKTTVRPSVHCQWKGKTVKHRQKIKVCKSCIYICNDGILEEHYHEENDGAGN